MFLLKLCQCETVLQEGLDSWYTN